MLLLTYTDEEVERAYEEFYEDVHTEFLKFGEIVNFKVCRNASSHLRGNVYVHYKSLDSAVLAYESVNGRYFAGKQVQCEFVGVTRWKVAICGEFMKSKLKNCSRGTTCNFIHCFRNPGGDYEWADWDKPPPKYWVKEMAALFGYPDESKHDERTEQGSPRSLRYSSVRSQSEFSRNYCDDDLRSSQPRRRHRSYNRELDYDERNDVSKFREKWQRGNGSIDPDSDNDEHRKIRLASRCGSSDDEDGPVVNMHDNDTDTYCHERSRRSRRHMEKHGVKQQSRSASIDHDSEKDGLRKRKLASRGGSSEDENGPDENLHDTDTETYHHERSRRSRRHMVKHGSKGDEQIERHRERSPRSDVSDHKRINSSLWDHSDRGSGEVELDDRDSRRSYRSSKHNRRKDRSREEKGVRDETKPHNRIDERDRWAPDEGD